MTRRKYSVCHYICEMCNVNTEAMLNFHTLIAKTIAAELLLTCLWFTCIAQYFVKAHIRGECKIRVYVRDYVCFYSH